MDQAEISQQKENPTIAIVGNPNSGKTTLFNALSGLNQRVGNFPGVTVERKSTKLQLSDSTVQLVDLPGVNSLYPQAGDEGVTTDILRNPAHKDYPDAVLVLADATQLRRGLMLCMQVLDLGFPAVLGLNMMDLLEADGSSLELDKLSNLLSIPVVAISASRKEGLTELKQALLNPGNPAKPFMAIPPGFLHALTPLKERLQTDSTYLAYQTLINPEATPGITEDDVKQIRQEAHLEDGTTGQLISNELLVRLDRADAYMQDVLKPPPGLRERLTERLDSLLTHPLLGYMMFLGILLLIFQSIFVWAETPMGWIETGIENGKDWLTQFLPEDHFLSNLLTEGIITGLAGIVVFVPQIAFLFFFFSILEDSGYMARAVFIMDRIMRPFGFSGRSVIPLMGGMACAIPSIMMARSIVNPRERLITIMVTPLISCSARIPVYTLLIAMFVPEQKLFGWMDQRGLIMMGMYVLGFLMALVVALVIKTFLKHDSHNLFVMELPAFRMPRWKNIGITVWQKCWTFIREAGQVILVVSIVLWLLQTYGPADKMDQINEKYAQLIEQTDQDDAHAIASLEKERDAEKLNSSFAGTLGHWIEPVIKPLGYDWKIGISIIASFAAREVFVGTMSVIYGTDDPDGIEEEEGQKSGRLRLIEKMRQETDPETGNPIYNLATVLSLLIFYAIAMQCVSTLAVTIKEAGWKWAWIMLVYLTLLAYLSAWGTHSLVSMLT